MVRRLTQWVPRIHYYDEQGNPITQFVDIKSDIYDVEGNVVCSYDDFKKGYAYIILLIFLFYKGFHKNYHFLPASHHYSTGEEGANQLFIY